MTAALLAILSVVIVARSTETGASQHVPIEARAASAAPAALPSHSSPTSYGIIIVADEAQGARIREGLADGAALVDPGEALSVAFDVVVVADDAAAGRLRETLAAGNSLLAGTGREPAVFDARGG